MVLALGLITALTQISKRLENLPGKWITVNTWLLFFAYMFLPVGLFWLLDRTGAIHDTSLFAAVLIGFGYQQILTGELSSIRAASEIAKFWQPFAVWADHVADSIRNRIQRNEAHFDERLLAEVRKDEEKQKTLGELASTHTNDLKKLQQALAQIEDNQDALGSVGVLVKTVETFYDDLKTCAPHTWQFLLYERGITSTWTYCWYGKEWRSKAAAVTVAVTLLIIASVAFVKLWTPENRGQYYVWRLQKTNNTEEDRYRAGRHLLACLQETQKPYYPLAELLRLHGLPIKTAENILDLLIESRNINSNLQPGLRVLLAESLRTDNPDIRARIHEVLIYLASERNTEIGTLKDWKPSAKDSLNDIDGRIKEWEQIKWTD